VESGRDRGGRTNDVWLVRYDPRMQSVQVKEGDNRGQTVSHRNIVRQIVNLGAWSGHKRVFHLPAAPEDGLNSVVLVQGENGGPIVAAIELAAKS
jgi:hypothetical protein